MFAVKKGWNMHKCINSNQFQITSFASHISYLSDELVIDFEWLGLWFSLKMIGIKTLQRMTEAAVCVIVIGLQALDFAVVF
jgi:hypothetical protein